MNEKTAWFPLIRGKRGSLAWCRCASGPADESPMTACGGNFIGDEIRRNEQCPHEADLRRLSLRGTPPTRMQSIRGKPGNHPMGKFTFPIGCSRAFLGQKPSNFPSPQRARRSLSAYPNYVISPVVGPGRSPPWRRSGGAQPPASPYPLPLEFTFENTTVNSIKHES